MAVKYHDKTDSYVLVWNLAYVKEEYDVARLGRKLLRRIYGPVKEIKGWRIRMINELTVLVHMMDILVVSYT